MVNVVADVLHRASVELIVMTAHDEARLHDERRAVARAYGLDLRYMVCGLTHGTPAAYPKICSIWDADRPVMLRDLIIATNALYGGQGAEKAPGGGPNTSGST